VDARTLLYRLMEENRLHARQSEDRRIFLTAANALAASIILVALAVLPSTLRVLPLAVWLTLFGTVGIVLCLKLYERAQFHELRARKLRDRLNELAPDSGAQAALATADKEHSTMHGRTMAIRLNVLLVSLNAIVAVLGLVYILLIAINIR
jgi:hypothetical protein